MHHPVNKLRHPFLLASTATVSVSCQNKLFYPLLTRGRLVSELELEAVDGLPLVVLDGERVRPARHLLRHRVDRQRRLELALNLL